MPSLSKNVYIDKWDDIVNEYNNVYHGTVKVKNKTSTYIESSQKINNKDPKFKTDDIVRISKYINGKGCAPNWSRKVFLIKKVK